MRRFAYDPECEDLARHFLAEDGFDKSELTDLAFTIQEAVEGWFSSRADEAPTPETVTA